MVASLRALALALRWLLGPQQLDSSVGTGFWLDEVCMYVYENPENSELTLRITAKS
eukprot:COSAG01_NODE_325_length_18790_cov_64.371101_15_plen_56_part_00